MVYMSLKKRMIPVLAQCEDLMYLRNVEYQKNLSKLMHQLRAVGWFHKEV